VHQPFGTGTPNAYRISTIKRKQIEEPFGWIKTVGGLRKTRHCGRALVEWFFVLTAAAYNLIRIVHLPEYQFGPTSLTLNLADLDQLGKGERLSALLPSQLATG
jgi:Transposase DDE domain